MDICKWLHDTEVANEHGPRNHPDPAPIVAPTANAVEHRDRRTRKRKQLTDSSIIAPHQETYVRDRPTPPRDAEPASLDSRSQSEPRSENSESQESDDHPYKRRKRRKTRPEKYDAKPARTGVRQSPKRKKDHGKKEERKRKRKRKDGPEPGVVKDYKAKNVSASRLTLPAKSNVGLFRKGRASSPFRARGVPDLAFSEMRFLQKRREPTEEEPHKESRWTKRKRDRDRAAEQEMSVYFLPSRSVLTDRDPNLPSKPPASSGPRRKKHYDRKDKLREIDERLFVPSIELPPSPALGFRETRQRARSTTYYTWSESARQPPSNPVDATELHAPKPNTAAYIEHISRQADRGQSEGHGNALDRPKKQVGLRDQRHRHRPLSCHVDPAAEQHRQRRRPSSVVSRNLQAPPRLGHRQALDEPQGPPVRSSRKSSSPPTKEKTIEQRETAPHPVEEVEPTTQRECTSLDGLLNQCEQAATAVLPSLDPAPPMPRVDDAETLPSVLHDWSPAEGYMEGVNESLRYTGHITFQEPHPHVHCLPYEVPLEEDFNDPDPGQPIADPIDWNEEVDIEEYYDVNQPEHSAYGYEQEETLETDGMMEDHANIEMAAEDNVLLSSVQPARDQHVFDDWKKDVQDEELVPADFWRPNKLY